MAPAAAAIAHLAGSTRLLWSMAAAIALVLPFLLSDYIVFRFSLALIWSIALLGMVLLCGVSGQFSFAQPVFYGLGSYLAAILVNHSGLSVYLAIPGSVLLGLLAGYLVGLVAGGQGVWNQALVTFALAVAFPQLLRWPVIEKLTGGSSGLYLDVLTVPDWIGISADRCWYLLCLALLAMGLWLAHNIIDSRSGRALRAVRDNELAAWAHGIAVRHYRAMAFALGAGYAALAGCLVAMQYSYVAPGTYSFALSVQFLFGVVIGGLHSIAGAVIGGLFLQFFPDLVAVLGKGLSHLLYAVLLIAAILAMPEGVAGLLGGLRRRLTRRAAPRSGP